MNKNTESKVRNAIQQHSPDNGISQGGKDGRTVVPHQLLSDEMLNVQSVIEDRYGIDPDTNIIEGVPVRHPNRHHDDVHSGKRAGAKTMPPGKSRRASGLSGNAIEGGADSGLPPGVASGLHFYVLVISKKRSKLFKGDETGLTFIEIPEMPNGIDDVVHVEEKDGQNLIRSGSGAKGGAVYHGTGSSRPDDKANIAMYLAEVDNTLRKEILRNEQAPLLLAGVGYVISAYRRISRYQNIWRSELTGSHEFDTDKDLHAAAMELMRGYFETPKHQALADYGNKSDTNLTSFIIDDIIRAAHYKRVETLFVDKRARLRGSFDETSDLLIVHASDRDGDGDLIDQTISRTLASGGKVFMLDAREMPVHRMMAAVMRYE